MPFFAWKRRVADLIYAAAYEMPYGKISRSLIQKSIRLSLCATRIGVRQCQSCGEPRAGSGKLFAPGKCNLGTPDKTEGYPCQTRVCPFCGRRIARRQIAQLHTRIEHMRETPGFAWRFITLTLQRDPTDPATGTPAALRTTIRGLWAAASDLWRHGLGRKGAALYATIELAGSGHVHMHLLHYGNFSNKSWLEGVVRDAFAPFEAESQRRPGFADVRLITKPSAASTVHSVEGKSELLRAVREVVKYAAKSASTKDERWIEGGDRDCLHPVLAANWEIAMHRQHAHRMWGALRRRVKEADVEEAERSIDAEEDAPDSRVACAHCGTVGAWDWLCGDAASVLQAMHEEGHSAIAGSRWKPPDRSARSGRLIVAIEVLGNDLRIKHVPEI